MNIRDALAAITFDVELDDDEMVTDALILARVTRMSDGRATFTIAGNDGLDTVVRAGLLECGRQISASGWEAIDGDEV